VVGSAQIATNDGESAVNTEPGFVPVTADNVSEISERLEKDGGFLITVRTALNWLFTITLYDRPSIRIDPKLWIVSRHQGSNAKDPLNDREYRFAKAREKKELDALFTSLEVGAYRVTIGPEWGGLTGMEFVHGQYFYVPVREDLSKMFVHIFEHSVAPLEPALTRTEIDRIIAYALEDLKTKAVVREIIEAGMDADAACGIA